MAPLPCFPRPPTSLARPHFGQGRPYKEPWLHSFLFCDGGSKGEKDTNISVARFPFGFNVQILKLGVAFLGLIAVFERKN